MQGWLSITLKSFGAGVQQGGFSKVTAARLGSLQWQEQGHSSGLSLQFPAGGSEVSLVHPAGSGLQPHVPQGAQRCLGSVLHEQTR